MFLLFVYRNFALRTLKYYVHWRGTRFFQGLTTYYTNDHDDEVDFLSEICVKTILTHLQIQVRKKIISQLCFTHKIGRQLLSQQLFETIFYTMSMICPRLGATHLICLNTQIVHLQKEKIH